MTLRLCLSGPVEVLVRDAPVDLGPPQRRAVLAALAVDAGRPVPLAVLIDRTWGADPPEGARRALYAHIARIRRLAERLDDDGEGRLPVLRRSGGYQLDLDPDRVDLHRFHRLAALARDSAQPDPMRATLLREALALWRGEPLAGLPGTWPVRMREAWRRQRVDAAVRLAGIEIHSGDPAAVVDQLADLLGEYPLTEPLAEALMRALHAAGDSGEALRCYAQTRQRLVEELGTEPGRRLWDLHQEILRESPLRHVHNHEAVPAPAAAPPNPSATRSTRTDPTPHRAGREAPVSLAAVPAPSRDRAPDTAPAQLPLGVPGFTGRTDELARLDALLADAGRHPAAVVVSAISGMGGVGKTALAVHWARQVRSAFPDGQLYVNLRGFDPGGAPLAPDRAVRGFLDALGVLVARVPESLEAQVGLYRSLLCGRRVLVVLDNARDADQVRPLLPGAPGCLALVTSRSPLTGLAVGEGAHLLALDLLTAEECRDLLAARLGAARVAAEAAAVDEIVVRCAGLPLALAVAAARAAARPAVPLAGFADELRTAERILDPLDTGDPVTAVRTVFHWSYRTLSPQAARLFRFLGLHPGPDADLTALAALAGVGVGQVRETAGELTAAHLLNEHAPQRYACHDLLRAYAVELVADHDDEPTVRAATRRVLDHYLHTAYAADALLTRRRHPMALAPPEPGALPRQLADYDEALAWLIAERSVLLSAVERPPAGFDGYTWQFAATLTTFLERQGNWQALTDVHTVALRAAMNHEDLAGQAAGHRGLGLARFQLRDPQGARHHFTRALDLFRQLDNHAGQARTRQNLAKMAWAHGAPREALHHSRRSLEHFRLAHDRGGQAVALNDMGWYLAELGELRQALAYCRQALPLVQATGDLSGQAHTWDSLGYIHRHLGRHATAVECYDRALALFRKTGDRRSEAIGLTYLGDTHEAAGAPGPALDAWRRALDLFDELGLPEADTLRTNLRMRAPADPVPLGCQDVV
ncbi:AfsR/SARP family transcriptional regulator [Streptomyces sp. HD]|uniref:AfsR/SARP family transcriptional regulator n=1 Tax=Streptomyces sp. HD TaxID=3020892 RepID=UPI00232F5141|nr:BTAD domain-containing putative transcriptional regulator [Streptomyces sp. HD]MDC0768752.1 BTAD domain-containing putative transcriptional regulator [Streptomyces sp. HD]